MSELQDQIKRLEAEILALKEIDIDKLVERAFNEVFGDLK